MATSTVSSPVPSSRFAHRVWGALQHLVDVAVGYPCLLGERFAAARVAQRHRHVDPVARPPSIKGRELDVGSKPARLHDDAIGAHPATLAAALDQHLRDMVLPPAKARHREEKLRHCADAVMADPAILFLEDVLAHHGVGRETTHEPLLVRRVVRPGIARQQLVDFDLVGRGSGGTVGHFEPFRWQRRD